jgi:hypothetical protein
MTTRAGAYGENQNLWQDLVSGGAIQGDWNYYADRVASGDEYRNAYSTALANANPALRRQLVDYAFDEGAATGDRGYWYENRGAEDQSLVNALTQYSAPGGTPAEAGGVAAPTPQSGAMATGGNFWNEMVAQGLIGGDPNYYASGQAQPGEYQNALQVALAAANPDQRRMIVDYLFDSGAAAGDRTYWYEPRGAEDMNLATTLGAAPATAAPGGSATETTVGRGLADLRRQRLEGALELIGTNYDLQAGEVRGQQAALGEQFRQMMYQLGIQGEAGRENIGENAAERGILRSGIYAGNLSEFAGQQAEQEASVERVYGTEAGREGTEWRQLQSALQLLDQQRAQEEAQARLEAEQQELEIQQLEALAAAGLA